MGYFQVPQISQIYTDFYSVPVYYKARECVISS